MSANRKILKADGETPTEVEVAVAQALYDLEMSVPELKKELRPLQLIAASEIEVGGGKTALAIFVPVPSIGAYHKIQQRLTRELEKKFSDRHVLFIAKRKIVPKPHRGQRPGQKRPMSRTVAKVHEAMLEDLVYPTEIVGKRKRTSVDGTKLLKVFLDQKDANTVDYKLDTFMTVYKKLTGKAVHFEFPHPVEV